MLKLFSEKYYNRAGNDNARNSATTSGILLLVPSFVSLFLHLVFCTYRRSYYPCIQLQLPNIRQGSASLLPPLQDGQPLSSQQIQPPLQSNLQIGVLNRLPDGKLPAVPQNSSVLPPASLQSIHGQPRLQVVSQTQNQVPLQLGQSGGASSLTAQVQPLTGLPVIRPQTSITTSKPLQQQMQPPLPQQPRPVGYAVQRTVQSTIQNQAIQSLPSQPISKQNASKVLSVCNSDFLALYGISFCLSGVHIRY